MPRSTDCLKTRLNDLLPLVCNASVNNWVSQNAQCAKCATSPSLHCKVAGIDSGSPMVTKRTGPTPTSKVATTVGKLPSTDTSSNNPPDRVPTNTHDTTTAFGTQ
ncbi:hypothetical protein BCR44DRAFT_237610 [Catenaria anguillulae PL171]|uniref:Uncharacterized protein n=1 Tax=Catenaria anguillulae PL171 TaxID=765915 RepID=A0A1Y2H6Q2_9FUNG|nr:hypothetical protein BCR44DRAFT_237610 [Catenaria anguillulae PL171]